MAVSSSRLVGQQQSCECCEFSLSYPAAFSWSSQEALSDMW